MPIPSARGRSAFRGLWGPGGVAPRHFLGKALFSTRPLAPEARGQRPTALCALGRKGVWTFFSLAPLLRGEGRGEGLSPRVARVDSPVPPPPPPQGAGASSPRRGGA